MHDAEGKDLTITDSLWIIVFGCNGFLGLVALGLVIGLPAALVFLRLPATSWLHPLFAPPVVLAMTLVLYLIDDLANGMVNPLFMLIAGGLNSLNLTADWWIPPSAVNAKALGELNRQAPATIRSQPGKTVRAVAKYETLPLTDVDRNAPHDLGVDHSCPAL